MVFIRTSVLLDSLNQTSTCEHVAREVPANAFLSLLSWRRGSWFFNLLDWNMVNLGVMSFPAPTSDVNGRQRVGCLVPGSSIQQVFEWSLVITLSGFHFHIKHSHLIHC